jgi:hypothetical protein
MGFFEKIRSLSGQAKTGSALPVEILIFGTNPPCTRCLQAEKIAREVAALFPEGLILIRKLDAWSDAGVRYKVTMTPTTMINGKRAAVGKVLSAEELKSLLDGIVAGHAV